VAGYDPNGERSVWICRAVHRNAVCYGLLYQKKKMAGVQLSLDRCFKEVDEAPLE
jgi:ribosomal protein L15E